VVYNESYFSISETQKPGTVPVARDVGTVPALWGLFLNQKLGKVPGLWDCPRSPGQSNFEVFDTCCRPLL